MINKIDVYICLSTEFQECRFTKCNFCTLVKSQLGASKHDRAKLNDVVKDHLKHYYYKYTNFT